MPSYVDATFGWDDITVTTIGAPVPTSGGALVEGDLILFDLQWDNASVDVSTAPAGAVAVIPTQTMSDSTAASDRAALYYKFITAGEAGTSPSWGFAMTAGTPNSRIIVARFRSVNQTDPFAVAGNYAANVDNGATASLTHTSPAITTTGPGAFVVVGSGHMHSTATCTPPSGSTAIFNAGGFGGGRAGGMAHFGTLASAGSAPIRTWTYATAAGGWAWQTALRDPSDSGTPTVTQRFAPDAILAQTGLTGAVSTIQDDPDSPDANWLTA